MRLPALLTRWLDVLAGLLIGWHELLRARRSLEIRFADGRLRVRQAGSAQEIELTDASGEAASQKAAARRARGSFVVYEFDAEPSPEDRAILEVRVLIAARAIIEQACAELAALGLAPDRIVGCAAGRPV